MAHRLCVFKIVAGEGIECQHCGRFVVGNSDTNSVSNCRVASSRIGTRLKEIIKRETGQATPCGSCARMIDKLNAMTAEEVEADRESIVDQIIENGSTNAALWYQRWACKLELAGVRSRVNAWIDEAIKAEHDER